MSDVVTLMTITGEVVGRLKEETDSYYELENPRNFIHTEEGAGYAPGISVTGINGKELTSAKFNKSAVLTMIKSDEGAKKAWQQVTSGIIL